MSAPADRRARRVNRLQNLAIVLLALSAMFLFASLPLFGAFSDRSLIELGQDRLRRERNAVGDGAAVSARIAFPVRMVYTNDFACLGSGSLTTLSDEFENAGTYLGEALGSAAGGIRIDETGFLLALRDTGLYFDFGAALPNELLTELLGAGLTQPGVEGLRRALLAPSELGDAVLYVQDGARGCYRFSTAVSSSALIDFLASQSGESVDFAASLGPSCAALSPYTIVLSDPAPRKVLAAANLTASGGDEFLRRAGFSAHAENRFREESGTVVVREVSRTLYLRADGAVEYQGGEVSPDTPYYVRSAAPNAPTLSEAAAAAQGLMSALTDGLLGDAALSMSGVREREGRYEITFDLTANGIPVRFSDGSHAASVTVAGSCVRAFTLRARSYTLTEETALLLPFSFSAAIARVWNGAELVVAYVDAGREEVSPAWIAE